MGPLPDKHFVMAFASLRLNCGYLFPELSLYELRQWSQAFPDSGSLHRGHWLVCEERLLT